MQSIILKHLANHNKNLANCVMIILELHLRLNAKQNTEKVSKILNPKEMLQRLPIALAQVKAGNNLKIY